MGPSPQRRRTMLEWGCEGWTATGRAPTLGRHQAAAAAAMCGGAASQTSSAPEEIWSTRRLWGRDAPFALLMPSCFKVPAAPRRVAGDGSKSPHAGHPFTPHRTPQRQRRSALLSSRQQTRKKMHI